MTSTEIARRQVVEFGAFRNRVEIPLSVPLPKNTLDPRYRACANHRTACDCREAMLAEERAELLARLREAREAFDRVLEGHATWVEAPNREQEEQLQCKCTGCEIARALMYRYASSVLVKTWDVLPSLPDGVLDIDSGCLAGESEVPF